MKDEKPSEHGSKESIDENIKYLNAFANDINNINSTIFGTPERKRKAHLAHFFTEIDKWMEHRQEVMDNYVDGSNVVLPQFEISREVMPDVFSYSGYSETDVLRNQSKKDEVVISMLDESLEKGPAMLIDIGTYDGKRTRSIISKLKNKKNITHITGIDTNPIVRNAFDNLDVPHTILNTDARKILHPSALFNYSIFSTIPQRKIYLGLENVLMNITRLSGCEHENFSGVVSTMLRPRDEIIFELSNFYDDSKYVDGVEEVFHRYFNETGLKDILGGFLRAEIGHPDSPQKMVMIDEVREFVEYEGKKYHFARPKLKFRSNFMGGPKKDGLMETDAFSQPYIFVGVSQSLPREESFLTAIMFYINHVIVQKQSDWQFIDGESVVKLVKDPEHKVVSDKELQNILVYTAMETQRRRLKPLFRNLTDVLIGTGQYPSYYNALLDKVDMIFLEEGFSEAVKCFVNNRVGKIDPKVQQNMNKYALLLLAGKAKELSYDPFHGMKIHSFMDINFAG